jgi:hypothetical protein
VAFIHHGNHVWCVGFLLVEYIWCISYRNELICHLFCFINKGIAQTRCQLDSELYFSNESHDSNFLNERMGRTTYDAFRYSKTVVLVVGILGNILVIISILRQKIVLKNNYYFLVRHLAMYDVGVLIIYLFDCINIYFVEEQLDNNLIYVTPFKSQE